MIDSRALGVVAAAIGVGLLGAVLARARRDEPGVGEGADASADPARLGGSGRDRTGSRSRRWSGGGTVPVEATVLASGVRHDYHPLGSIYYPEIDYRYEIDGRRYVSDRVFRSGADARGRRDARWARQVVSDYAPGARVTARVDPARPDRAFLVDDRAGPDLGPPSVAARAVVDRLASRLSP
jgi:hypothetical protein